MNEKKKYFVLDTNVLVSDPDCLNNFEDNIIYIPQEVLSELDKLKKFKGDTGVNARAVNKKLDELTTDGVPEKGISLQSGGLLRFICDDVPESVIPCNTGSLDQTYLQSQLIRLNNTLEEKLGYADIKILERVKKLSDDNKNVKVVLVSKDINLRVRARIEGVPTEDYKHDKAKIDLNDFFKREISYNVDSELINKIYQNKLKGIKASEMTIETVPGEYFILKSGSQSILVKNKKGTILPLERYYVAEGITPRNPQQSFLMDACFDPEFEKVCSLGMAGTGKTIIAVAAGLSQVLRLGKKESERYKKVVIFRPTDFSGIGFLPGDVSDKISPHFRPIDTVLETILGDTQYLGLDRLIEKVPIDFIRGDTIQNSYVIVDEAQNFTREQIRLIGSRMGEGSKIVLVGDPYQIDNQFLDEKNNGLTIVTDRFRKASARLEITDFAYVILNKGERSKISADFAKYI